jgi:hypothetical protein
MGLTEENSRFKRSEKRPKMFKGKKKETTQGQGKSSRRLETPIRLAHLRELNY